MQLKTIPITLHPNFTKVAALILGYTLWLFVSSYQWVSHEYTIPVCFYQTNARTIQAPETIKIKITGPRNHMHFFNHQQLAMHIDLSAYQDGNHEILLDHTNLFLPEPLKLIELIPSVISLQIQTNPKT